MKKKNLSYVVIGVFIILVLIVLATYLRFGVDLRPCTQQPDKPLESTFTMKSDGTTVRITWSKVNKATSYRLYLTVGDVNPTTTQFNQNVITTETSYNFPAKEGQTYRVILTAVNDCGESKPTNVRQVTPCAKPSSVSNFNAICSNTITLTFAPAKNAIKYDVAFIYDNSIVGIFQDLTYPETQNIVFNPPSPCYQRKITITVTSYSGCGETSKSSFVLN